MDPATISAVLGIAGQATGTLAGAIDLVKRLRASQTSELDPEELRDLAGQLAEQLYATRMNNLEIVTRLQELQRTAESEDEFRVTLAKYLPLELEAGGNVLALRGNVKDSTLFQKICPTCSQKDRVISPLQGAESSFELTCATCGSSFPNKPSGPPIVVV